MRDIPKGVVILACARAKPGDKEDALAHGLVLQEQPCYRCEQTVLANKLCQFLMKEGGVLICHDCMRYAP